MNLIQKLKLTKELDQIANEVASGTLPMMARIQKVRRIDEIIATLTATAAAPAAPEPGQENTTLQELVNKRQVLAIRLREPYEFERCVRDYVSAGIEDNKERTAFLHAMNATNLIDSNATYLRDQLAIDLEGGVYVRKNKHAGGGMFIGKYLKADNPFWGMLEWLYDNKRLITGDKALRPGISENGDMFSLDGDPTDDQASKTTADEDFEAEAKSDLVDGPADEAGAFYQSVIDGAEVDENLIQKAIEYATADEKHWLLPEAAEVIKNAVLASVN